LLLDGESNHLDPYKMPPELSGVWRYERGKKLRKGHLELERWKQIEIDQR
jgi:hypothetical protein